MSETERTETERRAHFTAGLRALADLLDAHPELELPYDGYRSPISVIPYGAQAQREQLAAWAKALPGEKKKDARDTQFYLTGSLHGLEVRLICTRDDVCERVVTGTRQVVIEEADPAAVAALPKVRRVETVEDVEWRCGSVLAERESAYTEPGDTERTAIVEEDAAEALAEVDEPGETVGELYDRLTPGVPTPAYGVVVTRVPGPTNDPLPHRVPETWPAPGVRGDAIGVINHILDGEAAR